MWTILKAELSYNKFPLAGLFSLILVVFIMESLMFIRDLAIAHVLIPFFMAHTMFITMNKEKRERHNMLLPVSSGKIAFLRIILIISPFLIFFTLNFIIRYYFLTGNFKSVQEDEFFSLPTVSWYGLYILGYFVYIVLHDLFSNSKRINESFSLSKFAFIIVLFLFTLGAVVLTIMAANEGETPLFIQLIDRVLGFLFSQNGVIAIYLFTLCFTFLSVYTFVRRTSYLCI